MKHVNYLLHKGLNVNIKDNGNLSITGISHLQNDLKNQVLQYAKKNKWCILFEIQTQNKTLEEKINILWKKAWTLADWTDDPESEVHWKERTKYVPDVLAMGREIDLLKAQQINPVIEPKICPARCKRTGKCYGSVYFTGKPGKFQSPPCDPKNCKWRVLKNEQQIN